MQVAIQLSNEVDPATLRAAAQRLGRRMTL
jgi:hypothetical protein